MNKILVCFFSASGTTLSKAQKIKELLNADIFEIKPENPYTESDLNWMDKNSRSSLEMNDNSSRPKINGKLDNLDDYETVLIGFPIWWYTAPRIINTFIESNDLTNKKVFIFTTSGSSSFEKSLNDLKESYPNINFIGGFNAKKLDEKEILDLINL